jgi:NADPH:quinone reductase-like Zn-dependent oxidoreductase
MRQVVIPRLGPPSVLEVREAPDPTPGEGEVVLKVSHAGINFADLLMRMGLYPGAPKLPSVVGYEVSGTVESIGAGVTNWKVGDRALALTRFGGYAERVAVLATRLFPIPAGWNDVEAAAFPVNYLTAGAMLLGQANVQPGEVVLVHGAGGGVGLAALQLCKQRGARVIATAGTSKHERLKAMGVEVCLDSRQPVRPETIRELTSGRGADVILDPIGGDSFRRSYASLASLGRLVLYGASALAPGRSRFWPSVLWGLFRMPRFAALDLVGKNLSVMGFHAGRLAGDEAKLMRLMEELLRLAAAGHLRPVVDSVHSFADAPVAHARLQERKNFGKVLLTP